MDGLVGTIGLLDTEFLEFLDASSLDSLKSALEIPLERLALRPRPVDVLRARFLVWRNLRLRAERVVYLAPTSA